MVCLIFRHISGTRATELDVVPLGAHRELILGRAVSAAVRFHPVADRRVGRHHARIEPTLDDPTGFVIADLDSSNGTWVNGRRIRGAVSLRSGDRIRLGERGPEVQFLIEIAPAVAAPARA